MSNFENSVYELSARLLQQTEEQKDEEAYVQTELRQIIFICIAACILIIFNLILIVYCLHRKYKLRNQQVAPVGMES